jgi:hypothetical protein
MDPDIAAGRGIKGLSPLEKHTSFLFLLFFFFTFI